MIKDFGSLQLTISIEDSFVYDELEGNDTDKNKILEAWKEIAEYCFENKLNRVIVKRNITKNFNLLDIDEMIQKIAKVGFENLKLAIVDNKASNANKRLFAENLAQINKIETKTFEDVQAAEHWILGL